MHKLLAAICLVLTVLLSIGCSSTNQEDHYITIEVVPNDYVSQPGTVLHLQTEYGSDFAAISKDMESMVQNWLQSHPQYVDDGILEEGRTLSEHGGYTMRRLVHQK